MKAIEWEDGDGDQCIIRDAEEKAGEIYVEALGKHRFVGVFMRRDIEDKLYKALRKRRRERGAKKKPAKPTRLLREFVEAVAAHRVAVFATDHDMTTMGNNDNNWLAYYRTIAREVLDRNQ